MDHLIESHSLSVQRGCQCIGISRAAYYRKLQSDTERDAGVINALNDLIGRHARWGFWKCFNFLKAKGSPWNHKRIYRVYCELRLNQKRRAKKRVPKRERQPLLVPQRQNQVWSADFMSDALLFGSRFRTFNVIDDFNRESVAIEIDTSITAKRLIRVFEILKLTRGLPDVLRLDNGPEGTSAEFAAWAEEQGMIIQYIQPGEPNQNAYIERFNRTYREEVLSLYLFESLDEVREVTYWWRITYNEERPHDSLGSLTPAEYAENSTLQLST